MWNYIDSDILQHYGIKGQKWGIRRFQNKDGSYTNAGKARYSAFGMKHDVRRARKAAQKENVPGRTKQSTGSNYDKALKEKRKLLDFLDRKYNDVLNQEKTAKSEKKIISVWNDYDRIMGETLEKGRRLTTEAMLKDAGYSDEDAKAGYEYLRERGIDLGVQPLTYYGSSKKRS